jgi:hypothetical protein
VFPNYTLHTIKQLREANTAFGQLKTALGTHSEGEIGMAGENWDRAILYAEGVVRGWLRLNEAAKKRCNAERAAVAKAGK